MYGPVRLQWGKLLIMMSVIIRIDGVGTAEVCWQVMQQYYRVVV